MTVRVLIVDDQEPFRAAARMVVDVTDGFEVVGEAESGEDSVAWPQELEPDLVLMDVNLPGINGLDATRQDPRRLADRVVVLLLSTYEEEEYAPRAAECGAAAYIPKAVVRSRPARGRLGGRRPSRGLADRAPSRTVVPAPGADSIGQATRRSPRGGPPCPAGPCRARPSPGRTRRRRRATSNVSVAVVCASERSPARPSRTSRCCWSASSEQK